jgi:hypothetical protein
VSHEGENKMNQLKSLQLWRLRDDWESVLPSSDESFHSYLKKLQVCIYRILCSEVQRGVRVCTCVYVRDEVYAQVKPQQH